MTVLQWNLLVLDTLVNNGLIVNLGIVKPTSLELNYLVHLPIAYTNNNYVLLSHSTEPNSYSASNNFISSDNMVTASARSNRKDISQFYLDRVVANFKVCWFTIGS